ncbi:leucine-rich repeat-containing protein 9 [Chanos chanos]|uniref:Leucine-rich repeat-containing protein 9 n=1 Tax=Chanos chanos TaxID=29144 RepID=A0A6J2V8X4_CHACN|nr:leucine-rich repeat-containing protein 9 [Chanos chanos]
MTQSEKQRQSGDEEIIKELCISNGVSHEKIPQEGSDVATLEMFFSGYPRMVGLSFFPRLSKLTIVGQSIQLIQGLDYCPLLRELWVVECQLTEISGLQRCLQLQKLYLYDNKICQIENLDSLVNLQVLWLNSNRITVIEGLNSLENLTELNLADNSVATIGHSLDRNTNLRILNLSGNNISSFKELTHLARLPRLRELGLKDPQSSPNPVCLLYNYATHVLYHMPSLQKLDSYDVSAKQVKDAAASTVMKKMMYYNMRVRSAQRQFAELQAKLQQQKKKLLQLPEERIQMLSYNLKNLECELSEVQTASRRSAQMWEDLGHDPGYEQRLLNKLDTVKERLRLWSCRLNEVEASYQRELALATDRKELMVHFLLMELETVGNIRFEEGNTSDSWFTCCYDLLLSRFCALDYKPYGISGIKINRIIRIHNRALRHRFEDKLHTLLANQESAVFSQNYKRFLEYLFYVSDPKHTTEKSEILHIPEEGFKSADEYKALGRERAVPLSNSLSVTDRPRIQFLQRQSTQSEGRQVMDTLPFRHGQIIISKVFLGRSVPVRNGISVDSSHYSRAHSVYRNISKDQNTTDKGNTPETLCSSRPHDGCECNQRQSEWFVFDHELVLPEYLVDFEYITQDRSQVTLSPESDLCASTNAVPLSSAELAVDEEVLGLDPVLNPKPKMVSLDEKAILTVARANILSQITVLNLHGNSLNRLKEISRLTALQHLTISFNALTHLDDISHMPNLEWVDASFNEIVTLGGMRGLGRLKQLDLRWNQLTRTREDTAVLRKHAPSLLQLDTRHNPWHKCGSVRMTILGRLKTLTHLDGVLVSEEEAAAAIQMAAGSRISQAALLAHSRTDLERPRSLSLLSVAHLLTHLSPSPWAGTTDTEPGWLSKITALNLDGQHLSRLTNLDKLVNLRWASFNNNEISRIDGLENCRLLEELSLDHNTISKLDGVSKLYRLTRLSLNGNQLTSLDGMVLQCLPNLHFLSAEGNNISSLHGVQRVRSLLELFVGNNHITTTRDIYHLKALTNLIILDLYGNPVVERLENYRIYVVFHLPSLKALDGVAVEVTESENAKDVFGGRLTPDMLAEKLGHSNYKDISELDLPSCGIRMVDLAPPELFQNLRSINLERNNLTSFGGLVYLPSIKALCLNYNHIESILPRQKTHTHLTNRQILYHKVHSSGYGQQSSSKSGKEAGPGDILEPLMGSLEVLHLSHNGISNLANLQLSRLTNLKALFLQGNEIIQVEGLEGLQYLRELVLDRNRIKSFGENSFCSQSALLELHLAENRIRELNHLQPLTELRRLFLDMNKLQDAAELHKLEVLPSLIELSVVGNPVVRRYSYRPTMVLRLPTLQVLDGITVTLEERTRAELLSTEAQCSALSGSGVDMTLPGLLPLMSRAPPVRGNSLTSTLQYCPAHDILMHANMDDTQPLDPNKYKKQRPSGAAQSRSAQADLTSRQSRGTSSLSSTGLLPNGLRVHITYPNAEQDLR